MRASTLMLLTTMLLAAVMGCTDAVVIEGQPSGPPKLAIRVNCGATAEYTDKQGTKWLADQVLTGPATWGAADGLTITRAAMEIAGTDAPELYLTERYSMTAYQFALDNGKYTLRLHFAETFDPHKDAGMRLFSVKVNGEVKLENLDVFTEAGGFAKPLVKEWRDVAVTDGKLRIEFVANVQNPEINAIEILRY